MKVLIVCSGNAENFDFRIHQAFVYEQIEVVRKIFETEYDTYFINDKGFWGYLKNLFSLRRKIKRSTIDIVHAHFGLSGLLSTMQRIKPVIVTLHGSDMNIKKNSYFSLSARYFARATIFVSQKMASKLKSKKNDYTIPCGVDFKTFFPINKSEARKILGYGSDQKLVLFSSRFDNAVKNYSLAKSSIHYLREEEDIILVELKGYSREKVNLLLNAADVALLTSFSEGSPQFIKEAMACNCPIVATDVGDIKEVISGTEGCYVTSFDPKDVAEKIQKALDIGKRTNGREKIARFDNKIIARQIYEVYQKVLNTNR